MEDLNILMVGAGNRVSLAEWLIEAGKTYNRKVNLYSLEIKDPVPISSCATVLKGFKWNDPMFVPHLMHTISHYNIHIVVPLMDQATVELSKLKQQIEIVYGKEVWVVVSNPNLCEYFNNKTLSEAWFDVYSIRRPPSSIFANYPVIIKEQLGYGSHGMFKANNPLEFNSIVANNHLDLNNYIVQEIIPGEEYTVDAYVSKAGKLIGAVSRLRLETINGESTRTLVKQEPELIQEVTRILTLPGFLGPQTLQFIRSSKDNKFYIVEINPRYGGSVLCSFKAGANFAECLIADYLNLPLPDCSNIKEGLLMLKAWREFYF